MLAILLVVAIAILVYALLARFTDQTVAAVGAILVLLVGLLGFPHG